MALSTEKHLSVSKRPKWWLFCTGGLLTTGGLGWCLRLACAEEPKAAMVSYLAGSAGVGLMSVAAINLSAKETSKIPTRNWLMLITGGVLSASGFGYCLILGLLERPKSTVIAHAVGSVGYVMANTVLYAVSGNGKKRTKSRYYELSNKEIRDIVDSANARIHYMGSENQCAYCKAYVEEEIRKRKEAEEQGIPTNTRPLNKPSSEKHGNEASSGRSERIAKSDPKTLIMSNPFSGPKNLSRDLVEVSKPPCALDLTGYSLTVSNKFPEEKSTQTEKGNTISSTQTEESYLGDSNETASEDTATTDSQSEADEGALVEEQVSSDLAKGSHEQGLLEVPTEDQQIELEDKQRVEISSD